ncbi:formate--tetrahydrofolate ligase [Fervidibacillus halotolerans]|uniref:Formate--tetrahydrofolate ligase n=1 Tax=Fervidibacillus halotolerans TaxID=2980027 RepID=A0A9E8M0P4_9BACI|nr:formate--tetrahydrofolate ligase [Fervidibacillus halotolerans]WAA13270.1 formate--tetrahydrofolate ligase [Fervidibacillus halotolerans]
MQRENSKIRSDLEIAQSATLLPITQVADKIGLTENDMELYGKYKGKIRFEALHALENRRDGRLILVTSMNPTPLGEGKSTVTIGLGDALNRLGHRSILALREPSLGPVMGIKGGAAGGGYAQVVPMEDINLHFTGDLHAITVANNVLASIIDNHIFQGNKLGIDPGRITWKRALDANDRALRNIVVGLGGKGNGVPREDHFEITAASEMMAIFTLAEDLVDLKEKIARTVVAYTYEKKPVTVGDLGAEGALTVLLKDAFQPNLVQTLENTPALVHGGPFANIAHGCNSLIATKTALKLADYVITEAGFGADLGAEKFFNIKSRIGKLTPTATVIVATIRALKFHGGVNREELYDENVDALREGFHNLLKHIETIKEFQVPFVVALNRFITDKEREILEFEKLCNEYDIPFAVTEVWEKGGAGGIQLAERLLAVIDQAEKDHSPTFYPLYPLDISLEEKMNVIAKKVYGAKGIELSPKAERQLRELEQNGWSKLPICMAKTQYSLSDDPNKLGRPKDFTIHIRQLKPSIGAGFIVAYTGDILTMPGLPKHPAALKINIDDSGKVTGLF